MKNIIFNYSNRSTFQQLKEKAFTLAETLVVIGVIGVVAALTLPNLNSKTGDKETATRALKVYSSLVEANDRAVAFYGPIKDWPEECRAALPKCWMKRVGKFLKTAKSCNEVYCSNEEGDECTSCSSFRKGNMEGDTMFQLSDGAVIASTSGFDQNCTYSGWGLNSTINDICIESLYVDINGPNKGKNEGGTDVFHFGVSNSLGVLAKKDHSCSTQQCEVNECMKHNKNSKWGTTYTARDCTFWLIEYGNIDYQYADSTGKCNNKPSIVLDGATNTTCF